MSDIYVMISMSGKHAIIEMLAAKKSVYISLLFFILLLK